MSVLNFDEINKAKGVTQEILLRELFNAEMAGNSPFIPRFGVERQRQMIREAAKRERASLETLLLNPVYRAAHDKAARALNDLYDRAYEALEQTRKQMQDAQEALDQFLDTVPRLPSGAYDLPENTPRGERYQSLTQELEAAQESYNRTRELNETTLPALQERWDAHNNGEPMSLDELEEFSKEIEHQTANLTQSHLNEDVILIEHSQSAIHLDIEDMGL